MIFQMLLLALYILYFLFRGPVKIRYVLFDSSIKAALRVILPLSPTVGTLVYFKDA